jgi:hypothetical protein
VVDCFPVMPVVWGATGMPPPRAVDCLFVMPVDWGTTRLPVTWAVIGAEGGSGVALAWTDPAGPAFLKKDVSEAADSGGG